MDDKEQFFLALEQLGEPAVRAQLASGKWASRKEQVIEWLGLKEAARLRDREEQAIRALSAAERSATAAERSAHASEEASEGTKDAARWAMWAAIIALVSTIVNVIKGCSH